MKFLESFNRFKKKPKEEFKGKKETYRFTDIHNDPTTGERMGRCRECGEVVDVSEHTEEECLNDYSIKESYNDEQLKFMLLHRTTTNGFKNNLHKNTKYKDKIFPPVQLEKKLGISGVSQEYNIPLNLTEAEYENLAVIFKEDDEVINFLFNELLKENPKLNIFKNTYKKFNVIDGVTSKIKIEDIKDYIENSANITELPSKLDLRFKFKRNDGNNIQYQNLWNSLVEADIKPTWFPSIETMNYIYKKVKKTI